MKWKEGMEVQLREIIRIGTTMGPFLMATTRESVTRATGCIHSSELTGSIL